MTNYNAGDRVMVVATTGSAYYGYYGTVIGVGKSMEDTLICLVEFTKPPEGRDACAWFASSELKCTRKARSYD